MASSSESKVAETTSFAATFRGEDLIAILTPKILGNVPTSEGSVSTDSRSLQPGQWYLALKGDTYDGHQFVADAIKRGAAGCIVSSVPAEFESLSNGALFVVPDTLAGYHQIARAWLDRVKPFVIGVTGSSGKTTTKEMCAAVVSSVPHHKSRANENNEFGLPKTILSMPAETQVLVLEMGMRGLGQIALLARTAKPHVSIITCVGTAHIELLGSAQNIIKAKCEILEEMRKDGTAIIGNPTGELVSRARIVFTGKLEFFSSDDVKETSATLESTKFAVSGFETDFEMHAHGLRHMQDAWCAIIAGRAAGLSDEAIAKGLRTYRSVEGRGNKIRLPNGVVVIDETYNANPDSVKCAVEAMLDSRAFPQRNKFVVLGEMAELGSNEELMHQQTGEWLKHKQFHTLITVGEKAGVIARGANGGKFEIRECADQSEALNVLREYLDAESCVMIKGSRRANLEMLVTNLSESNQ